MIHELKIKAEQKLKNLLIKFLSEDSKNGFMIVDKFEFESWLETELEAERQRTAYLIKENKIISRNVKQFSERGFNQYECPVCSKTEGLFNYDERPQEYCGQCGTKINWAGEYDKPILFATRGFSEYREFICSMRKMLEKKQLELEDAKIKLKSFEKKKIAIEIPDGQLVCPCCYEEHSLKNKTGFCDSCGQRLQIVEKR